MPDHDFDGLLSGFDETPYVPQEKKGAPQIDAPELDDLLAPPPTTWTGNAEKKGAPQVDEPVLLDDPMQTAWTAPTEKRGAPQVEAPELDAGPSYTETKSSSEKKDVLSEDLAADLFGDAPQTYDPVEEFYRKMQFTDDLKTVFAGLPAEKQQQVVEMRAKQMGISVPSIPKQLRPKEEAAPLPAAEEIVLEEAPKPKEYVPQFKDEDLERVKEESKKPQKYVPPPIELTEEKKKENRRIMNELREEREKTAAKKGFHQLIVLAIVGVVGAAALALYFSGAFGLGYQLEEELGWMAYIKDYSIYYGVAMGIFSVLLIAPVPALKGFAKLLDGLAAVLMLFPGIPLLSQKVAGHGLENGLLLGVALVCSAASFVTLITSENIRMYNKHGNS